MMVDWWVLPKGLSMVDVLVATWEHSLVARLDFQMAETMDKN